MSDSMKFREPSKSDFRVEVEGIGVFVFARRTMRDEIRIAARYSKLVEGDESPVSWLQQFANAFAALDVLTVQAPDGWNHATLDPLDEDSFSSLIKVYGALREKEQSFRSGSRSVD